MVHLARMPRRCPICSPPRPISRNSNVICTACGVHRCSD
ncbi:hypothetical protein D7223_27220 [Micromonospora endolithica]|uniref:Uncharacterized protein n=1 Tax=Micromonospora endolithica TaxID=230091 RepID=A0A3A9YVZ1_9ACTN|nr:hypothetical protein D7223_27220 [Micromonospora endolithica]